MRRSPSTIAAAVSSQLDSSPRISVTALPCHRPAG
jgi:hypothetical protein